MQGGSPRLCECGRVEYLTEACALQGGKSIFGGEGRLGVEKVEEGEAGLVARALEATLTYNYSSSSCEPSHITAAAATAPRASEASGGPGGPLRRVGPLPPTSATRPSS